MTDGRQVANCYPLVSGRPAQTISIDDPGFPRRLRDARSALDGLPDRLDVLGALTEHDLAVAIVGARAATGEDLGKARELAHEVAARGGVVVSGGALGVDSAAHRGALEAGGATVVVLGTGIDVLYPQRNAPLFQAIADRGGAVVSSFERELGPRQWSFVERNATIAALVDVVVVIGASARSGSLHTAAAARRLGRKLAAVPGTAGCDRLIAGGAALLERVDDLDRCLAGDPRRPVVVLPPSGSDAWRVLDALSDRQPRDLDDVTSLTGLPLGAAQRALADLELRGLVQLAAGHAYLRSPLALTA